MLDFNEELAKFQPCADLEEAEENIYGKELEEIKKNKTELYKANQMIKKYSGRVSIVLLKGLYKAPAGVFVNSSVL